MRSTPPRAPLFPYTTLFRSSGRHRVVEHDDQPPPDRYGTEQSDLLLQAWWNPIGGRSEEHTSELQSRPHLVCRLLLEKKKLVVRLFQHSLADCKLFLLSSFE